MSEEEFVSAVELVQEAAGRICGGDAGRAVRHQGS